MSTGPDGVLDTSGPQLQPTLSCPESQTPPLRGLAALVPRFLETELLVTPLLQFWAGCPGAHPCH